MEFEFVIRGNDRRKMRTAVIGNMYLAADGSVGFNRRSGVDRRGGHGRVLVRPDGRLVRETGNKFIDEVLLK